MIDSKTFRKFKQKGMCLTHEYIKDERALITIVSTEDIICKKKYVSFFHSIKIINVLLKKWPFKTYMN